MWPPGRSAAIAVGEAEVSSSPRWVFGALEERLRKFIEGGGSDIFPCLEYRLNNLAPRLPSSISAHHWSRYSLL